MPKEARGAPPAARRGARRPSRFERAAKARAVCAMARLCSAAERPVNHLIAGQRMSRRSGIRFADKDMRQQENLRRIPFKMDH